MKLIAILSIFLLNTFTTAQSSDTFSASSAVEVSNLVTGRDFGCVIDQNKKMRCFGLNGSISTTFPELTGVDFLAAFDRNVCAINSGSGLKCFGGITNIPSSLIGVKVRTVAVSYSGGCAATQEKVSCWGNVNDSLKDIKVRNVSQIVFEPVIDGDFICTLSEGMVNCFNNSSTPLSYDITPPLFDGKVTELKALPNSVCARVSNLWHCWGANNKHLESFIDSQPRLYDIKWVHDHDKWGTTVDSSGKIYGDGFMYINRPLIGVTELSQFSGLTGTCFIDYNGVNCFASKNTTNDSFNIPSDLYRRPSNINAELIETLNNSCFTNSDNEKLLIKYLA